MLLPSSIHRADDFVGIAIPIVGFFCAIAPLLSAMAEKPASASAVIVVFSFDMLHSLGFFSNVDLALEFGISLGVPRSGACKLDIRLAAAARRHVEEKGAACLRISGSGGLVEVTPGRGD